MIAIPEFLWELLLDEFARTVPSVERVAFLDGFNLEDVGVVTTLTIPDADLQRSSYTVSAEAMSQAGQHFREHRMTRLAQVHTHGGRDCHHSPTDDYLAYSQRSGAVSIVLPGHASQRPTPHDGLIHLGTPSGWRNLAPASAAEFVHPIPSFLDFRSTRWIASRIDTAGPSTGGFFRRMKRRLSRFR